MKTMAPYAFSALVLGGLAALFAAAGTVEREIAAAQTDLVIANLTAADHRYAEVWEWVGEDHWLSWALAGTRAEIEAKRGAIRYWRGDLLVPPRRLYERHRTRDFERTSR